MDFEMVKLTNRVIKEYYEVGLSQKEISFKENISKSTVSRILLKAKEDGLVSFKLDLEYESLEELENELKKEFCLERVRIREEIIAGVNNRLHDVAQMLSDDLSKMIRNHDIIGVSWGSTLQMVARVLEPIYPIRQGIEIVELCGSITSDWASLNSYNILREFAEKVQGKPIIYPVPILIENEDLASRLREESQIKKVIQIAEKARITIFTAGNLNTKSVLLENGALDFAMFGKLMRMGATGDILFHFLDQQGNLIDEELDQRTMAISLEALKKTEIRILIAVGEHKVDSIISALRSGVPNHLYIDEKTAIQVLKKHNRTKVWF